jgi:hypothetical protein
MLPEGAADVSWVRRIAAVVAAALGGVAIAVALGWAEHQPLHQPPKIPGIQPTCTAVDACLKLLDDPDPAVRDAAATRLGFLKDPKSVPPLIRIVEAHIPTGDQYFADMRRDNSLALTAMRTLGAIGDRRALPALVEFTKKEPFIQSRVLAAEMIRQIGVRTADIPSLLDLLNDPHTSVRYVIFEAIRRADDPVTKRYTQRFISFVPRADVMEDSVTNPPKAEQIGVPIYTGSTYLLYASASEQWIMRERPQRLSKTKWLHTFLTKDPVKQVVGFYEGQFRKRALTRSEIDKQYNYSGAEDPDPKYIGEGFGFVLTKGERDSLRAPIVVISVYEDKILEGTAVTISAPK